MAGNSHGHTLAAWTGVIIAFIGFTISGVCTVLAMPIGVVGGLVVAAVGGVVGWAMKAAGFGQPTPKGLLMESDERPGARSGAQAAQPGVNGARTGTAHGEAGTSGEAGEKSEAQPQEQSS